MKTLHRDGRVMRVALLSTARMDHPGSMRAYVDMLLHAFSKHVPQIQATVVELDPRPHRGSADERLQAIAIPWRAWRHRGIAPDIWHVTDGSRAYSAMALGNAPLAITVHDMIPWLQSEGRIANAPSMSRAGRWLWGRNRMVMRKAAQLTCVSTSTMADATREFALPEDRVNVVPVTLRAEMQCRVSADRVAARALGVVLHVGNNGFYKNRIGVLRIFASLDKSRAQRLLMAGPPPTDSLRAEAEALGISERIEWLTDPSDESLAGLYRTATVLLFPSLYEGFGSPVLEAMAFGLPVVASDAASLPEVVGEGGWCLPLENQDRFVQLLDRLLSDPAMVRDAGERGRIRAQDFSEEKFAAGMFETYCRALVIREKAMERA